MFRCSKKKQSSDQLFSALGAALDFPVEPSQPDRQPHRQLRDLLDLLQELVVLAANRTSLRDRGIGFFVGCPAGRFETGF
jgi:hypothetical protein